MTENKGRIRDDNDMQQKSLTRPARDFAAHGQQLNP